MIWTLAGFVTLLGLVMWIVGTVRGYLGIAVIGAVLVLGTGAIVANSGLEYRTGETRIQETANRTVVSNQYRTIATPQQLSLGGLWMLFGALLAIHSLNEVS